MDRSDLLIPGFMLRADLGQLPTAPQVGLAHHHNAGRPGNSPVASCSASRRLLRPRPPTDLDLRVFDKAGEKRVVDCFVERM